MSEKKRSEGKEAKAPITCSGFQIYISLHCGPFCNNTMAQLEEESH